jgi:hypothetical protein
MSTPQQSPRRRYLDLASPNMDLFRWMRRTWPGLMLALGLFLLPAGITLRVAGSALPAVALAADDTAPTFEIIGVVANQSVSIRTANFPASQTFTATMGPMGSKGVDGSVAGTVNSGKGGTFEATFNIPPAVRGSSQIAIRLESGGAFPYYAYNWFYNFTAVAPPPSPGQPPAPPEQEPVPAFSITKVIRDTSVSILTSNFPPRQRFEVTMGEFGTQGVGGVSVGSLDSGEGGALTATFNIPSKLKGLDQIAIRAQTSGDDPFFAYNWFYNVTTP